MPDLTPNLNLKKPNWDTDVADIRVFNDNMDIIDEKITDGNEAIQGLEEKKQNKEDSTLKTIAKKIVEAINELFDSKLEKGGYTGNAKNLNDEISKKASKTVLGRMIVGDNLTVDDNGRVSATKTEIVNDLVTGGVDKAGSAEMVKKLGEDKQDKIDSGLQTDSKEIVGAINESLWREKANKLSTEYTSIADERREGVFWSHANFQPTDLPVGCRDVYNLRNMSFYNNSRNYLLQEVTDGFSNKYLRNISYSGEVEKWREFLFNDSKIFLGVSGLNGVLYIQDVGQKIIDEVYIDKDTGKLYIANETNNDTSVTAKFRLATNAENAKNSKKFKELGVLNQAGQTLNVANYSELVVYSYGALNTVTGTYHLFSSIQGITIDDYGSQSTYETRFAYNNNTITLVDRGTTGDGYLRIFGR